MAYKRVNFQLDQGLADAFVSYAKRSGMTKAKLLRQIILGASELNVALQRRFYEGRSTTFNFRVDAAALRMLLAWQSQYGLSLSALIRIALLQFLERSSPRLEMTVPQRNVAVGGGLEAKAAVLENRYELLNVAELMSLARMHLLLGRLDKVQELVADAEKLLVARPMDAPEFSQVWLTKGIYLRHKRQLAPAQKYIAKALSLATQHSQSEIASTAWAELSILSGLREDFAQALRQSEAGMELLTVDKQPTSYIKSYLRLASLYSMQGDQAQCYRYVERCLNLLKTLPHKKGLHAHVYTRLSLIYARFQDLTSAGIARSRLDPGRLTGMDAHFDAENKGLVALLRGDLDAAYSFFRTSEVLEAELRGQQLFSKVKLWKLFIEARHNLPYTLRQLNQLQYLEHNPYPSLAKYVAASAKYLYGDGFVRRQGANELAAVADSGRYPLIVAGAKSTLEKNSFQLVV